jgi:hypothetical protein
VPLFSVYYAMFNKAPDAGKKQIGIGFGTEDVVRIVQ